MKEILPSFINLSGGFFVVYLLIYIMSYYNANKESPKDKYPILVYCEVITHEVEEQDGYAVPKDCRLIQLDVYDYSPQGIWEQLNKKHYYSDKWRLMTYWQPEHLPDDPDCPF